MKLLTLVLLALSMSATANTQLERFNKEQDIIESIAICSYMYPDNANALLVQAAQRYAKIGKDILIPELSKDGGASIYHEYREAGINDDMFIGMAMAGTFERAQDIADARIETYLLNIDVPWHMYLNMKPEQKRTALAPLRKKLGCHLIP